MNKIRFLTALAVLLLISIPASAKVGTRNLEEDVKHELVCIPRINYIVTSSTTDTQGTNGVIFKTSVASISAPTSTTGGTGSPSTILWPSKLQVALLDAFPVGTLTCTSLVLTGEDQFGTPITETVSSITETFQTTTNVYSKLHTVLGAGCSASTGDVLQIKSTLELGLGRKVSSYLDIESICLWDDSAADAWGCAQANNGTDDDINTAFEASSNSFDLATTMFWTSSSTAGFLSGDQVCLRVRSSKTTGF